MLNGCCGEYSRILTDLCRNIRIGLFSCPSVFFFCVFSFSVYSDISPDFTDFFEKLSMES